MAEIKWWLWKVLSIVENILVLILTLGRTRKVIPPPWYRGGVDGPPLGFLAIFRNDAAFSRKPLIISTR